ncbi:MAG: exported protein of unknown function [Dehalococcoidia bacterium]|nr:exported protein of unknown function [Dehalococcoidia bacterium]
MIRRLRQRAHRHFLRLVFRLLYYEANWAYSLSAWLASAGAWRTWQQLLLAETRGQRVLEVGCGPGWLLSDIAQEDRFCVGLDLSPRMVRRAHKEAPQAMSVRADAQALPFRKEVFDTVVMCFSGLSYTPSVLAEAHRVLAPGGRIAITERVELRPRRPLEWVASRLWGLTDTGVEAPSRGEVLGNTSLRWNSQWVTVGFAKVEVTVGAKVF